LDYYFIHILLLSQ